MACPIRKLSFGELNDIDKTTALPGGGRPSSLRTMIDPDAPEPERRKYGLKRADPLAQAPADAPPPPALSVEESARLAGSHHDPKPRTHGGERMDDPNDVYAIRRELRAREIADDKDRIEIKDRKSRRKRDYWLVMIVLNAGFGGVLAYGILQRNVALMIYGLAGMIIASIGVTWVMWFIMSDY